MFETTIGIDLGTASSVVHLKGKGIIINEPSVVAVKKETNEIVAVGSAAQVMLGKTPPEIEVVRPLHAGVISSYTLAEAMIKSFLAQAMKRVSGKVKIMMCVPSGVTDVEQRAVIETARQMGGKEIYLIEEPMAAAIGSGADVVKAEGTMVIDIGGGTTDIAVISVGKIVSGRSLKIAGDEFTKSIIRYMRSEHTLVIGPQTAEHIKITIGTVDKNAEEVSCVARGICTVTGKPKSVIVTSTELKPCFDDLVFNIIERTKEVLEDVSPQLQGDILKNGIIITGGGSLLKGLPEKISAKLSIPVHIAEDPVSAVARGAGIALNTLNDNELKFYKKAYIQN